MLRYGWLSHFIDAHPGIVPVAIIVGMLTMLIASIIRAFQRWEILPDPLLPEKLRNIWYGLQKAGTDALVRGLSGRRNVD